MARRDMVFLPELIDPRKPKAWKTREVEIRQSAVDLVNRQAQVPRPYTAAQRMARLHEAMHVRMSPVNMKKVAAQVVARAASADILLDPMTVFRISKMLEENRIDWILWDKRGKDIRPAREVLKYGAMPIPEDPLSAMCQVLQLAWTVACSRGLANETHNPPPIREVKEEVAEYFDKCWAVILRHERGDELAAAVVAACLRMYADPTNEARDIAAIELAEFFPPPEPEPEPEPEEDEEELEEQQEAEEEAEEEEERREEKETGVGSEIQTITHYQIHDHTANIRRPSTRIARRFTPQPVGQQLVFPHRYLLDKNVFGRRVMTEAGIMVDGSGSMNWSNDKMQALVSKLPAVWVGLYFGVKIPNIYGRICILAKHGRFSSFEGREDGRSGGNDVDYEALEMLSRWPKPRFWLSDGYVGGGAHMGPYPGLDPGDPSMRDVEGYLARDGAVVHKVNQFMRRYDILRVNDFETMVALLDRKRVTLYRSCINKSGCATMMADDRRRAEQRGRLRDFDYAYPTLEAYTRAWYPEEFREEPLPFQL